MAETTFARSIPLRKSSGFITNLPASKPTRARASSHKGEFSGVISRECALPASACTASTTSSPAAREPTASESATAEPTTSTSPTSTHRADPYTSRTTAGIHDPASAGPADQKGEEKKKEEWDDNFEDTANLVPLVLHFGDRPSCTLKFPLGGSDDGVHSSRQSPIEITDLKARSHYVGNNPFADCVGQRTLQTTASLNTHLPVLHKDKENRAIVAALLADFPGTVNLLGIVIQRDPLR